MYKYVIIGTIIFLSLAGVVMIFLFRNNQQPISIANTTPTSSNPIPSLPVSPTVEVPQNWQTFTSQNHGFSIIYPPEIEVTERQNNQVTFLMLGETQTEGTELFDGISLTISSNSLNDKTLQQFVNDKTQTIKDEPTTRSVSPLQSVIVAGLQGYSFRVSSLGEANFTYLPQGENRYLEIINITVDPNNKGYQGTVSKMLQTLKLTENQTP